MRSTGRAPSGARLMASAVLAVLLMGPVTQAVAQGPGAEIPSVAMAPVGTTTDGPNAGQWFIFALEPGQTGHAIAKISNPADVAQTVKLYLRDLAFDADNNAQVVDGDQAGVGSWGRFEVPEATVPAKGSVDVVFAVTPPQGADPGDHVGVAVAESAPTNGYISVVKRVATRIYVTLPGLATRDFRIDTVDVSAPGFWPRRAEVTVNLVNTGRVRLRPAVSVDGEEARGAHMLMSHSSETYFADVRVPFYGGPVRIPVEVLADGGIARRGSVTIFVTPWGFLTALLVGAAALVGGALLWRRRFSRLETMRRELALVQEMVNAAGGRNGAKKPVAAASAPWGGPGS